MTNDHAYTILYSWINVWYRNWSDFNKNTLKSRKDYNRVIEDFDFDFEEYFKTQTLTDLVAVYGTLRKGMGNHHLLRSAEFLGTQITSPAWKMYSCGCPVIISGDSSIVIEVYKVSQNNLKVLDSLEGYPDLYNRKRIHTNWGDAWIYFMNKSDIIEYKSSIIPDGDYVKWRDS